MKIKLLLAACAAAGWCGHAGAAVLLPQDGAPVRRASSANADPARIRPHGATATTQTDSGLSTPASWALLMLGFGGAGLMLWRGDDRTRIRFS